MRAKRDALVGLMVAAALVGREPSGPPSDPCPDVRSRQDHSGG